MINPTANNRSLSSSATPRSALFLRYFNACGYASNVSAGDANMDVNRRHFIGAAGAASALVLSPDAARAAALTSTLTSALGRDVTQYGVRPGSPDDQTKALQRADR